jgi:hypothetical protein
MSGEFFGDGLILQRTLMELLDALDHSHPLTKVLGIYLSKKHQQMMTEEKSLEISFSELSALPPSQVQLAQENAEKDNEERSIVII